MACGRYKTKRTLTWKRMPLLTSSLGEHGKDKDWLPGHAAAGASVDKGVCNLGQLQ